MARRLVERSALQLSVRSATAATIAYAVAEGLGLPGPIYALISGVMVTDLDPAKSRSLAVPRILGTAIGSALGGALGVGLVAVAIAAAMLVAHVLRKPEAAKLAGYVCALVMLTHGSDAWAYAWWRCVETLIGIGAAVALSFVPKLVRDPPDDDPGR